VTYTLITTWILLALAALLGVLIGWLLAKKFCKCDDSALRAELNTAKIEANEHKAKVQGLVGQVDAHKSEVTKLKGSGSDILKHTQRIDELESAAAGAATAAAAATLAAKTKHDAELNALKAELTAATTKHAEAEQKIQGFASAGSSASASADGAVAAESAKLTARVTELEAAAAGAVAAAAAATAAAKAKHDSELAAIKAELTAATTKHAEAEQKIQGFASAGSLASADSAKLTARIAELEAEQAKASASVSSAADGSAKLSARIAELEAEKAKAAASVTAASDGSAKLSARIAELEAEQAKGVAAAAAAAAAAAGAATLSSSKHSDEIAALKAQLSECEAKNAEAQSTIQGFAAAAAAAPSISAEQLAAGAGILGLSKLGMDDLKVVEGIGPKIDELLVAGGITTWHQLSNTPVERIQSVLDAAGPSFRVANPATWARQAGLLANARWAEFKMLTDELTAGREQ
jgi:predicted  nucleic acid-binding Zn-ribbon protein